MSYIKEKFNKYDIKEDLQKIYLEKIKEQIKIIKKPEKIDKTKKSYIEAKEEVDLFLKKQRKILKKIMFFI